MGRIRWIAATLLSVTTLGARAQTTEGSALPSNIHETPAENIAEAADEAVLGWSFAQVDAGVYRGPRPTEKRLDLLKQKGIKTIINLQGPVLRWNEEKAQVEAHGMRYIGEPMSALPVWDVDVEQTRRILAVMSDPANQPVYVHCLLGNDRTGFIIGLYRVAYDHWSHEDALAEMRKYHYHVRRYPHFTHFFENFTGFTNFDSNPL